MAYNERQFQNLICELKKHIKGDEKVKRTAEKVMKKYGCNSSAEAYKLIKNYRKNMKVSEAR